MRARNVLHLLIAVTLLFSLSAAVVGATPAQTPLQPPANPSGILGPFTSEPIYPYVWNGDLRDLPQAGVTEEGSTPHTMPFRLTPAEMRAIEAKSPQQAANLKNLGGEDPAPPPIANFAGLQFSEFGAGWPPDTVGDVGRGTTQPRTAATDGDQPGTATAGGNEKVAPGHFSGFVCVHLTPF